MDNHSDNRRLERRYKKKRNFSEVAHRSNNTFQPNVSVASSSVMFSNSSEMMNANFEREQAKFLRGKQVLERIDIIRREMEDRNARKLKTYAEKIKRIEAEQEERYAKLEVSAHKRKEKRQKTIDARREILKEWDRICRNYEIRLEKRMEKLGGLLEEKMRKHFLEEQKLIRKSFEDKLVRIQKLNQTINEEEEKSVVILQKLIEKQENCVSHYENKIAQKVVQAHEHSEKVEELKNRNIRQSIDIIEEKLLKAIEKSKQSDLKADRKEEKWRKSAEIVRVNLQKKFNKKNTEIKKKEIEEKDRIKTIQQRLSQGDLVKDKVDNDKEVKRIGKVKHNAQRIQNHSAKYSKTVDQLFKYKETILDKHKHHAAAADALKEQKDRLAYQKRINNLELQKMRSSYPEAIFRRRQST